MRCAGLFFAFLDNGFGLVPFMDQIIPAESRHIPAPGADVHALDHGGDFLAVLRLVVDGGRRATRYEPQINKERYRFIQVISPSKKTVV